MVMPTIGSFDGLLGCDAVFRSDQELATTGSYPLDVRPAHC